MSGSNRTTAYVRRYDIIFCMVARKCRSSKLSDDVRAIIAATGLIVASFGFVLWHGRLQAAEKQVKNTVPATTSAVSHSIRIPILLYHYVEYVKDRRDTIRAGLNIQPHILEAQIKTLKDDGYLFVSSSYVSLALSGKIRPREKIVMLTFDDGYLDFYTDVFPILQRQQVRATAYIVPDFLDKPNFMHTWQLVEIAKSPFIEIGAHTMDHVLLPGADYKTAEYQITQSKTKLEHLLGIPVTSFAYPFGGFDEQAMRLAQKAGFSSAVVTKPNIIQTSNDRYALYRLRPGARTGKALLEYLAGDSFREY